MRPNLEQIEAEGAHLSERLVQVRTIDLVNLLGGALHGAKDVSAPMAIRFQLLRSVDHGLKLLPEEAAETKATILNNLQVTISALAVEMARKL